MKKDKGSFRSWISSHRLGLVLIFTYIILFINYYFIQPHHTVLKILIWIPGWVYVTGIAITMTITAIVKKYINYWLIFIATVMSLLFLWSNGLRYTKPNLNTFANTKQLTHIAVLNSLHFFSSASDSDLRLLNDRNYDILGFHEIWDYASEEEVQTLVTQHFPKYYHYRNGEFLVLSKTPLKNVTLSKYEGYQKIEIQPNLTLYNVHIWYPLAYRTQDQFHTPMAQGSYYPEDIRTLQTSELLGDIQDAKSKNREVLIIGDFNMLENEKRLRQFQSELVFLRKDGLSLNYTHKFAQLVQPLNQFDIISQLPVHKIDHTLISPSLKPQIQSFDIKCLPNISDHCLQEVVVDGEL